MTLTLNNTELRKDFPILAREVHGKRLAYLDNAASTLKPQAVVDSVSQHYALGASNIHRGVHLLSQEATELYEQTRSKVQNLIKAADTKEIIFTRGTTESINLVAQSFGQKFLNEGDEILISHMEHHSNIVPWQMLCEQKGCVLKVIPIDDQGQIIQQEFEQMLSERVKLLSLVWTSNSLGTINPIEPMIAKAKQYGCKVLIDAAQSIAHAPVDVQKLDCDFLAFSGHKLFGPTGIGVLYGKKDILEAMPPVQGGGDMILSVTFEKTTYNSLPYKFEAGTPHIAGVIGLGAAIDYIENIGLEAIASYEHELLAYATDSLSQISGLKIIGTAEHKVPVISFVLEGIHPHDIGTIVDEHGVALRTGHHCTQPVMQRFSIPATSRASMAFYNNREDIDQLADAIIKVQEIFQ